MEDDLHRMDLLDSRFNFKRDALGSRASRLKLNLDFDHITQILFSFLPSRNFLDDVFWISKTQTFRAILAYLTSCKVFLDFTGLAMNWLGHN